MSEVSLPPEIDSHMRTAFLKLRNKDRDIILDYYWGDLGFDELGRKLKCSAKSAQKRFVKARERFSNYFIYHKQEDQ